MKIILILIGSLLTLSNCNTQEQENTSKQSAETTNKETVILTEAEQLINKAIEAHGGDLYKKADYSFVFRQKQYRFTNNDENYTYSVEFTDENNLITKDKLTNETFTRTSNGALATLSKEDQDKYSAALNSVIYFTLLPYKLNDASVFKKYIEQTTIKGVSYAVIQVTFSEDGGGEDHEDVYHYWINETTNKIDYLAYNYHVNGGGARFRTAFNSRVIDGITFQDYINWEAPYEIPLKDIPALYEKGELREVSRIETSQIISLKEQ